MPWWAVLGWSALASGQADCPQPMGLVDTHGVVPTCACPPSVLPLVVRESWNALVWNGP